MALMDISELRGPVGLVLVLAAFVGITLLGKRVGRRWLRSPLRAAAISGATLTTLALVLVISGEYSCTARAPVAHSPDGKHVAILTWSLQGALGMDLASVNVRHSYSPFAENVYSGPGDSGGTDPQIRWIDNTHLLIRYHDYAGYEQTCTSRVFNVDVICDHSPAQYNIRSEQPK